MTIAELYAALDGIDGYQGKVAFHDFPTPPALPYIVYLTPSTENIFADNRTYYSAQRVNIELYTARKSTTDEALVESCLSSNDIPFTKSETYIDEESLYQTLYEITI